MTQLTLPAPPAMKCDWCRQLVAERVKVARWLVCEKCRDEYEKGVP